MAGANKLEVGRMKVNFILKIMGFVLKLMDFMLKMMDLVLNMMDLVLKRMNVFVFACVWKVPANIKDQTAQVSKNDELHLKPGICI